MDASEAVLLNDDAMVEGVFARAGRACVLVPGALNADRLVVDPRFTDADADAEPGRRMGSMGSSWNWERYSQASEEASVVKRPGAEEPITGFHSVGSRSVWLASWLWLWLWW